MTNYTCLASIRQVVLSSDAYCHYGRAVFPDGRRVGVTLGKEHDHFPYVGKEGNKQPLFTASNNPDGTVALTRHASVASTHKDFPCWLTIAGADLIRLCDKAGVDVGEPFMTLDEHLAFHYEPADYPFPAFKTPTLNDATRADLADFANAHLGSYFGKRQSIISRKLPNGGWQRRGGRHPRPPKRHKPSKGHRITRKGPNKRTMPANYTPAHLNADVSLRPLFGSFMSQKGGWG